MSSLCDRQTSLRRPVFALVGLTLLLAACDEGASQAQQTPPTPKVEVAEATAAKIPLTREFVGNTAAIKFVEIRAKVQGYLMERRFTEGADVKQGDVLFVIDQRPFEAEVARSQGDLEHSKAQLTFAEQQVERYSKLEADSFASVQRLESVQSQQLAAAGDVTAGEAALRNAQLNLEYSTITAPIDGRIGNTLVNIGNLVSAENTLLTTLVTIDPFYVYFSPSEAMYQEMAPYQAKAPLEVSIVLATGELYPHTGTVDFINNQVDASTGTILMRAVMPNPDKTQRPGQYVQARVTLTNDHEAILVPATSVALDEGGHYLFVVDADSKVERRTVTVGPLYEQRYVIDDGVKAGEQVVVSGIQRIRGGQQVDVTHPATADAHNAADSGSGGSSHTP